jgi:hypothetical protein
MTAKTIALEARIPGLLGPPCTTEQCLGSGRATPSAAEPQRRGILTFSYRFATIEASGQAESENAAPTRHSGAVAHE